MVKKITKVISSCPWYMSWCVCDVQILLKKIYFLWNLVWLINEEKQIQGLKPLEIMKQALRWFNFMKKGWSV